MGASNAPAGLQALRQRLRAAYKAGRRAATTTLYSTFPGLMPRDAGQRSWQEMSTRAGRWWARICWDSAEQPFRRALIEQLGRFPAPASLLELGCNSGPNLRLAAAAFPAARLTGLEANAQVVGLARQRLAAEGLSTPRLEAGTVEALLPGFPDASEDVVFSCYALAYVHPTDLRDVLAQALRVARRGLVLAEPQVRPGHRRELMNRLPWRHDYAGAFARLGLPQSAMTLRDLPPGKMWSELNAILTVDLDADRL